MTAAVLQRAFYPDAEPIKVTNSGTGHWSQRKPPARYVIDGDDQLGDTLEIPYGSVLGHHRLPGASISKAVYVVRDGRDVALSTYRWAKMRRPEQEDMTFSEFVRHDIDWRGAPWRQVEPEPGYTFWHHWRDHVRAWTNTSVLLIRYEGISEDAIRAVERVSRRFNIPQVPGWKPPGPVGWEPSKAPKAGAWRRDMSPEDVALFNAIVPADHPGRFEVTR